LAHVSPGSGSGQQGRVNGAGGDAPSETESKAFTVPFPEARKFRTASTVSFVFFFMFWILWGVVLFGPPEIPTWPVFIVMATAFSLYFGFSIYGTRKQKELAPVINDRFAEEFTAHTAEGYPQDVDILKVKRSVAVRRDDGSVSLWGVKRSKDAFTVFTMT
jgi:hypothetical protein